MGTLGTLDLREIPFPIVNNKIIQWADYKTFARDFTKDKRWVGALEYDKPTRLPRVLIKGLFVAGVLNIEITKISISRKPTVARRYKYRTNKRRPSENVGKHQVVAMVTATQTSIVPIYQFYNMHQVIAEGVWKFLQHTRVKDLENLEWK